MKKDELQPGRKRCLKCDKFFDSFDIRLNWICPVCSRGNQKEYTPRTTGSVVYTDKGRTNLDEHN